MAIRAKVDEDLPCEIAVLLRGLGHDALTVVEEGRTGSPDGPLWSLVQSEGRILFTGDKRVADARSHPPGTHAGIVLFRLPRESRDGYVRLAEFFLSCFDLAKASGAIVVVSPEAVRVRHA